MEKGNEQQSGEWIETFAGGPENPIEWLTQQMEAFGTPMLEDANGDVWEEPGGPGSGWVLSSRFADRIPPEQEDWKKRHPGKGS